MRLLLLAMLGVMATPVAAEPVPPAVAVPAVAVPAVATPAEPGPPASPCKRVVVGRGRDRRRVCHDPASMAVTTEGPRPSALIVHPDGRAIVGQPRTEDRLVGLPRHVD